jgi:hypothetical protein
MLLSQFSGIPDCLAKSAVQPRSRTATQPDSHRPIVSSDRLQLSCFKLSVKGRPYPALLIGGLGTSTEA